MNRIYFEALMVTIKTRRKIKLYIFCCLNFLLFSLRGSENRIFISDIFFTFGNAPLMLKIISKTLLIFFYSVIYFFSLYFQNYSLVKFYHKKNNFC